MPLRSVGLIRVTRVLVGLGVLVLVALVVLVGAAGCGSSAPRGSEGGRCQVDGSCDDDLVCVDTICRAPAATDAAVRPDGHIAPSLDAPPRVDAAPGVDALPGPDAAPGPDAGGGPSDAATAPPPDAPVTGVGSLHLSWQVRIDGAAASCATVGGVTVQAEARSVVGDHIAVGRFDCAVGSGTLLDIVPAGYAVAVTLRDADDQLLVGNSANATVVAEETAELGSFTFAFTNLGTFSATWSIAIDNVEASCADAGATTVEIESTSVDTGEHVIDQFLCDDGGGTTGTFASGPYQVTVRLVDADGFIIAVGNLGGFDIVAGEDTGLGDIAFLLPAEGGRIALGWSLFAGDIATTCAAVGAAYVDVIEIPVGGQVTYADLFDCVGHEGVATTALLDPGVYDVSIYLLDRHLDPLNFVTPSGTVLVESGATTDIGDFIFEF